MGFLADTKSPEGKTKESQLVTLLRLSQIRLRSHQFKSLDIFAADLRTSTPLVFLFYFLHPYHEMQQSHMKTNSTKK